MSEPKIVLWDLESLPNLKEVMKVFPSLSDYPGLTLKASINSIICFGYKIYGESKTNCISAWDFPTWKKDVNDDRSVCESAYEILKDADAVVTHNGKRFDWKFLQTRLAKHGLPALPSIKHIDTCAVLKSNLLLFNNRLNTAGKYLTSEEKMENGGWSLWVSVSERDKKAQKKMEEYCKQDVNVLEKVFKILRPFIKNLPNHNIFQPGATKLCPSCGSSRIVKDGTRLTQVSSYQRYRCNDCASYCQTNMNDELPRS